MFDDFADRLRHLVDENAPPLELDDLTSTRPIASRAPLAWAFPAVAVGVVMFVLVALVGSPESGSVALVTPPDPGSDSSLGVDAVDSLAESYASGWTTAPEHPVEGRGFPSLVWTGDEVIIWGGEDPNKTSWHATGAALDQDELRWRELADSPLAPRDGHVGVWTGSDMIICCGRIEVPVPRRRRTTPPPIHGESLPPHHSARRMPRQCGPVKR